MRDPAFDAALLACAKPLKGLALKLCRNTTAADDLVQQTYLKALRAHQQFQIGSSMLAWLTVIMRNEFYSEVRGSGRLLDDPEDLLSKTVPSNSNPLAALEAKDAISHLILLVPDQIQAVMMSAMGHSLEEIAAKVGVADGTIKSRIHRGREALAALTGA